MNETRIMDAINALDFEQEIELESINNNKSISRKELQKFMQSNNGWDFKTGLMTS
jgi:glutaredoxin